MMLSIARLAKKLWVERRFVAKIFLIVVITGLMFDSVVSMFYFWPSEGLYNDPPMWFMSAMFFVGSRVFETVRCVVTTYPSVVLPITLFLLAPFYKELFDRIKKTWNKIKIEITKLRETATYLFSPRLHRNVV